MTKQSKKKVKEDTKKKTPVVSQMDIIRDIQKKLKWLTLEEISQIINLEHDITIKYLRKGKKVLKHNYLILTPRELPGKEMYSPIAGKSITVPPKKTVSVRLGKKLKEGINN